MSIRLDGLEALKDVLSVREMMSLIERTARWASQDTFKLLPVWYPEFARGQKAYVKNWSEPRTGKAQDDGTPGIQRIQSNVDAARAMTKALGIPSDKPQNWACCHIWGVSNPRHVNTVVRDHRYYSCIANMVFLPSPLKAFTDHVPEVKAMLRACARNLYGWPTDEESLEGVTDTPFIGDDYPRSWPRTLGDAPPPGVVPITDAIRAAARKRLQDIRRDLREAGPHYPREQVIAALRHWGIPETV